MKSSAAVTLIIMGSILALSPWVDDYFRTRLLIEHIEHINAFPDWLKNQMQFGRPIGSIIFQVIGLLMVGTALKASINKKQN